MTRMRHLAVSVAALPLLACETPAPSELIAARSSANLSRQVLVSTTGGGQAVLPPPGFSQLRFAFNAKLHADGSASGQFRQFYESSDGTVEPAYRLVPVTNGSAKPLFAGSIPARASGKSTA